MELKAGYSALLPTDTDILYLSVGVYGVLGRKENVRCLRDLVFRVWGKCLEVSRILLWTPIGVFTREVGQELPRVVAPSIYLQSQMWPAAIFVSHDSTSPPVTNSEKQSFLIKLTVDQ